MNHHCIKRKAACATEESEAGNSSECDETSEVDLDTSSKVTGKVKWDKKKKARQKKWR